MDSTLRRLTVLIVDDHPAIRRLIRTLIAASATDVVECANGVEAVRAYGACRPDVVLMDLEMPELDGLAATRQIRAADPAAHIVIVTNHDDADLQDAAHRAGASGYVLKANLFDLERLLNGVTGNVIRIERMKPMRRGHTRCGWGRRLAHGASVGLMLTLCGGGVTDMMPAVRAQAGTTIMVIGTQQEVTFTAPNGVTNGNCTLGEAILAANRGASVDGCAVNGTALYTIELEAGQTYELTSVENWWYGPNALPVIASAIAIEGHGATLRIPEADAGGTPIVRLRFFYVGADPAASSTLGFNTPGAGRLTRGV